MNFRAARALSANRLSAAFVHRSAVTTRPLAVLSHTLRVPPTTVAFPTSVRSFSSSATPLSMASSSSTSGDDILASFSQPQHGQNVALAMESLATADAVCFDVDSTVIAEEGIDVLAEFLGQGQAVAALTKQAMEGSQKFQDALKDRLELMKPSKQAILSCLDQMPLKLSPGVAELIQALTDNGVHVYFVSGGFRIMIEPVAEQVGVPVDRIYANTILFDEHGTYTGFDPTEHTSADMGKPAALSAIKAAHGYDTMVMVGDGATDAQAKPPANAFIGFGGIVVRPAVQQAADWFVTDFQDMTRIVHTYHHNNNSKLN
ncbi:Phosphoserine phosphatase, chloroplastic [Seminavis robusta]|uniref:phosphoserine phosphatase n=1 Tax=Seminavis robusta TaxID=568900 RepID=A0A9N8ESN2_9STRA|nr:Phosphoserine phosphatase, chloroplastic [Seminavis robusta]|eukprot:Sro1842_g301040.1 Phosphoserine phosphatase, chloroplastic (317) ;mRNA; f:6832-7782